MGYESDVALVSALGSIGKVIAASAVPRHHVPRHDVREAGVFSTIGPALAVTIMVGFVASITLLPAMLALAGDAVCVSQTRTHQTPCGDQACGSCCIRSGIWSPASLSWRSWQAA